MSRGIDLPLQTDAVFIMSKHATKHTEFMELTGRFHEAWTSLELLTDCEIYKFLKVTPCQGHLINAGMFFSRKARLLADLVGNSDYPNKAAILGAFNKVRDNNERGIIAHSYVYSGNNTVTFLKLLNINSLLKSLKITSLHL